jgi:hypothetical protein
MLANKVHDGMEFWLHILCALKAYCYFVLQKWNYSLLLQLSLYVQVQVY